MTNSQRALYLAARGSRCLYCESRNLDAGLFDGEHQEVSCLDCNRRWRDELEIVGVEDVEDEQVEEAQDVES